MASNKNKEKYTKPALRKELKKKIKKSDKGGKPGEWSARKSQLLVQAYEKKGGGYRTKKKDAAAMSLEAWTAQNWQTLGGKTKAQQKGKMKRYLPKEVWDLLSKKQKKEAEKKKVKASKKGKQYVKWTPAIKDAFKEAGISIGKKKGKDELYQKAAGLGIEGYSKMKKKELRKAVMQAEQQSKKALFQQAKKLDIDGRSNMTKGKLRKAISKAEIDKLQEKSKDQLYKMAKKKDISGRSNMNKKELVKALVKRT